MATQARGNRGRVVTISFLTLLSAIGDAGTFFLFAFLTLVAVMYFWRRVPETKDCGWKRSAPRSRASMSRPAAPGDQTA